MLVLYNHNLSVCVQKVRLAMTEKGLAWEERNVDLMNSEQLSPEYLKMNPKGVVPTLLHDGAPVIESSIILEYLEDAFPDHPLRPAAPLDRARMRVWTKTPDDGLHAACGTVSYAAIFGQQVLAVHGREELDDRLAKLPDRARAARQRELLDNGIDASFVPQHFKLYEKVLGEMEAALGERPWLAGADFSLAECALLPYVWRLERLNLAKMWADRPNLADWFARCKARPSWDSAMEAYQALGGEDYDDDLRARDVDLWPKVQKMLAA